MLHFSVLITGLILSVMTEVSAGQLSFVSAAINVVVGEVGGKSGLKVKLTDDGTIFSQGHIRGSEPGAQGSLNATLRAYDIQTVTIQNSLIRLTPSPQSPLRPLSISVSPTILPSSVLIEVSDDVLLPSTISLLSETSTNSLARIIRSVYAPDGLSYDTGSETSDNPETTATLTPLTGLSAKADYQISSTDMPVPTAVLTSLQPSSDSSAVLTFSFSGQETVQLTGSGCDYRVIQGAGGENSGTTTTEQKTTSSQTSTTSVRSTGAITSSITGASSQLNNADSDNSNDSDDSDDTSADSDDSGVNTETVRQQEEPARKIAKVTTETEGSQNSTVESDPFNLKDFIDNPPADTGKKAYSPPVYPSRVPMINNPDSRQCHCGSFCNEC